MEKQNEIELVVEPRDTSEEKEDEVEYEPTGVLERRGHKAPMRLHVEHMPDCPKHKEFIERVEKACPDARITSEIGEGECFEILINEKVVYSRRLMHKNKWPNMDEMVEITTQMNQGRSFMHMYLCSYMEGGAVNMVVIDKKRTPLAKRVILACTIQ